MSEVANATELFEAAHEDGDLSDLSMQALEGLDIGQRIQEGLGVSADDVEASEVVLVSVMPDDSGSIRFAGNSQAVRDGCNSVWAALRTTKQHGSILGLNRYLNGDVLHPFVSLDEVKYMDNQNYNPSLGTPLYDQTISLLGTVMAKHREFHEAGVPVRTVTLIITDGADEHSIKTAKDVRPLVEDMLRQECHIIAAMGIPDGSSRVDFQNVFEEMGIRPEWILTPSNSESEIRKAFALVSQSAVRASQGGASFSQTAMGGFGA